MSTTCLEFANVSPDSVPHLDHLIGVWAIEPSAFDALLALVQSTDLSAHLLRQQEILASGGSGRGSGYRHDVGGVAIITASGTLQKHQQSMSSSTSTVQLRRDIRQAADDESIGCILMHFDSSPGGTAAGTMEFAEDIALAAKKKPVRCHVTDLCASAAYWAASAGDHISCNTAGLVGSIGTFTVVQDASGMAAQKGIKVHVVKSGGVKGMGVPGTEISAEQLAELQKMVDSRQELFTNGVAAGRRMAKSKVKDLADGRVHTAADSVELGLIDSVCTFDQALADARVAAGKFLSKQSQRGLKMSDTTSVPAQLTPAAVRAACPGCSSDFIVNSIDAGRTIEQCVNAHMQALCTARDDQAKQITELTSKVTELTTANATLTQQVETLKAENAELAKRPEQTGTTTTTVTKPNGVKPLPVNPKSEGGDTSGDPVAAYWDAVAKVQDGGKKTRAEAMKIVNTSNPELRQMMSAAANR